MQSGVCIEVEYVNSRLFIEVDRIKSKLSIERIVVLLRIIPRGICMSGLKISALQSYHKRRSIQFRILKEIREHFKVD